MLVTFRVDERHAHGQIDFGSGEDCLHRFVSSVVRASGPEQDVVVNKAARANLANAARAPCGMDHAQPAKVAVERQGIEPREPIRPFLGSGDGDLIEGRAVLPFIFRVARAQPFAARVADKVAQSVPLVVDRTTTRVRSAGLSLP